MPQHVTVELREDGQVALQTSPAIAGNRVAIYGLLQMGCELVHRLGDASPPSPIVIPRLEIPRDGH